jgi:small-conductance mechanosensitive channel
MQLVPSLAPAAVDLTEIPPAAEIALWLVGAVIVALIVAWLLIDVMRLVESALKARWTPVEGEDSRYAARVRTQIQVLRQILEALVIVVAIAVALLTFPGMRAVGASLLASAGLLSIVAGVAAQNSLSNVFAGLQIAFSDPVRL